MFRRSGSASRLEFLKKDAKRWLKALRAGDVDARARLEAALPDRATEAPTLRTVQLALARELGHAGWDALVDSLAARERALRAAADEMLRQAVFKGDPAVATRLYAQHPDVAELDLYTAVAAGRLDAVLRWLDTDPQAASRSGGPLRWPPLLYLAYLRWPGGATHAADIARALLDRGADPNALWLDDWGSRFTALAGVVGLGEGVKPPHERANELAELLLERGADPHDTQTFYDTSIVDDDTHWLELLWRHAERLGTVEQWRRIVPGREIGGKHALPALDFMLSLAVSYGHPRRAEWLLAHGANPDARHAYDVRPLREVALVHGNATIAALLDRHGATAAPLSLDAAFKVALRTGDHAEARNLAAAHPECLRDADVMIAAARHGHRDVVFLLLELGVDVDIEDGGGTRALHVAAGNGALDVMRLLLERGADADRPTRHYGGPMGFAAHFGQRAAAELLAPRSRDVHNLAFLGLKERLTGLFAAEPGLVNLVHFRHGFTPLFTLPADEDAALDMARFLLAHGADPELGNPAGDTPADDARKRGFERLAALLETAAR